MDEIETYYKAKKALTDIEKAIDEGGFEDILKGLPYSLDSDKSKYGKDIENIRAGTRDLRKALADYEVDNRIPAALLFLEHGETGERERIYLTPESAFVKTCGFKRIGDWDELEDKIPHCACEYTYAIEIEWGTKTYTVSEGIDDEETEKTVRRMKAEGCFDDTPECARKLLRYAGAYSDDENTKQ